MAKPRSWFRFYVEVPDDPKIHRLSDALYRLWVTCLCLAARHNGILPNLDDVAYRARKPAARVKAMLLELASPACGLLDQLEDGSFTPHNWKARQYETDNSTSRVREFRDRRKEPRPLADETVDETLQRVSIETNMQRFCSVSVSESGFDLKKLPTEAKLPGAVSTSFRQFWDRWCALTGRRVRESYACQAWISVVDFETESAAMACLERYGVSNEVRRGAVTNPDKWIYEQARDRWHADWPSTPEPSPPAGSQGRRLSAIEEAKKRAREGEQHGKETDINGRNRIDGNPSADAEVPGGFNWRRTVGLYADRSGAGTGVRGESHRRVA